MGNENGRYRGIPLLIESTASPSASGAMADVLFANHEGGYSGALVGGLFAGNTKELNGPNYSCSMRGLLAAGLLSGADGDLRGVQASGLVSVVTGKATGVQGSVIYNHAGSSGRGLLQLGLFNNVANYSPDVEERNITVQIGLWNRCGGRISPLINIRRRKAKKKSPKKE